jgi:hypothetical protein
MPVGNKRTDKELIEMLLDTLSTKEEKQKAKRILKELQSDGNIRIVCSCFFKLAAKRHQ